MPNWATSKLIISGDDNTLDELIEQVKRPYDQTYTNWKTKEEEVVRVEGNFLLWNIIRPTNLDAYYQRGEYAEKPREPQPDKSMEDIMDKITEGFATGMDWYNWNVRNWGTKWEISDDNAWIQRKPRAVEYELVTAWSPPVEAITNLAKQYPTLTFVLTSIDENDLFAVEVAWNNGEQSYEIDLPITHEIKQSLYGYCYACEDGLENPDDPEFDEERHAWQEESGCRASQNADLDVELGM